MVRNVPAGYEIALGGEQMRHATNLLSTFTKLLEKYEEEKDFDEKPKGSVEKMTIKKDGKETLLRCYPGKGESFRGNNDVKYAALDEYDHIDPLFLQRRVLPHYLRHEMGSFNTSTKNYPGHPNEVFHHSTDLMEVRNVSRMCSKCSLLPDFEERKRCTHSEPPDQPNQDESLRRVIAQYMSPEAQAAELFGDRYKTPDHLFNEKQIRKLFDLEGIALKNPSYYVMSIDPNQEGESENATVIFDVLETYTGKFFVTHYLNSFLSNDYDQKKTQFGKDIDIFVNEINLRKKRAYIFVESNTGNLGEDIKKHIRDRNYNHFIKVIHGRKWDKKLNKYKKAGYAKTKIRTKCYVDKLSGMLRSENIYFHRNLMTDVTLSMYNSVKVQKDKLKEQLLRFRNIKGTYTGKFTSTGSRVNDDLAIAFMAGLYMCKELTDPEHNLHTEMADW